jgi:type II secretory pathway pseudopilin PulG
MGNKSYTLIELIIVVLVLAIISSLSVVVWSSVVDKTEQKVCIQNEFIIANAIKFYVRDNNAVPTTYGQLLPKYTDIAIAYLNKKGPAFSLKRKIYVAFLDTNNALKRLKEPKNAYADTNLLRGYIGGNGSLLKCPADHSGKAVSYGINKDLATAPIGQVSIIFKQLEACQPGTPVVAECHSKNDVTDTIPTFETQAGTVVITGYLVFRHSVSLLSGEPTIGIAVSTTRSFYVYYSPSAQQPGGGYPCSPKTGKLDQNPTQGVIIQDVGETG